MREMCYFSKLLKFICANNSRPKVAVFDCICLSDEYFMNRAFCLHAATGLGSLINLPSQY